MKKFNIADITDLKTSDRFGNTSRFSSQRLETIGRPAGSGYPRSERLRVSIRFDDRCVNGFNSFSITGNIGEYAFGCIHEDIARVFPELAHLIKWHGCNEDGPQAYIANTTYLAGDRDYNGRKKGDVSSYVDALIFASLPFTFTPKRILADFIKAHPDGVYTKAELQVIPVPYVKRDDSQSDYRPKYTFAGLPVKQWHDAPFDTLAKAEEWAAALQIEHKWVKVPVAFSDGKERELDAARRVAVWPDATDDQLSLPKEELTALLSGRLPGLMAEFKRDIESIGFRLSASDI